MTALEILRERESALAAALDEQETELVDQEARVFDIANAVDETRRTLADIRDAISLLKPQRVFP